MDKVEELERKFMNNFSNLDTSNYDLPPKVKIPTYNKFLTNEVGIKYIGNILKDIDVRLYLEYLKIIKDNIKFNDKYDVEKSMCISKISSQIVKSVEIKVPNIKNGVDLFATAHEIAHGIALFTKIDNERYLHSNTMYDETLSILFGKLCLERYISDFHYDIYIQQFEILNIKNAIECLERIKILLPEYIKKQDRFYNKSAKIKKDSRYYDNKYYTFADEVEKLKYELYTLISYPIGISLVNVYDNFNDNQKKEYLKLISKYLLNIKHIDFEMILEYFNIPFNADFYTNNFKEYIDKFKKQNNKMLILEERK